ncbi:MAG: tetratricopeptide repeat protein [Spirochaetia bacterium]
MKSSMVLLILAPAVLFFFGCSVPQVETMLGNFSYRHGDYQESLVRYISAAEETRLNGWARFNLGDAYYALGEWDSAREEWSRAAELAEGDAEFASVFNLGVLSYHRAEYEEAYEFFRRAVVLRPGDREAKINLELSYRKMDMRREMGRRTREPKAGEVQLGEEDPGGRLLEFVNLIEKKQWIAPKEQPFETFAEDW